MYGKFPKTPEKRQEAAETLLGSSDMTKRVPHVKTKRALMGISDFKRVKAIVFFIYTIFET